MIAKPDALAVEGGCVFLGLALTGCLSTDLNGPLLELGLGLNCCCYNQSVCMYDHYIHTLMYFCMHASLSIYICTCMYTHTFCFRTCYSTLGVVFD